MAKKSQETALEHWGSEELLGMAPMAQKPQGEDAASSQEAAKEVPGIEVGSVGGTGEEAPEEAFNELKEPVSEVSGETMAGEMLADKVDESRVSGDKRPKSKWPWILVLVLVLAVAGVAMWYFWDHRGSEDDEKIEPGTGMDTEVEAGVGSGKDESIAPEIEELSVDDELVQRLYGQFEAARIGFNEFYRVMRGLAPGEWLAGAAAEGDGTDADLAKIGISISNLELTECRATLENGGLLGRYDGDLSWVLQNDHESQFIKQCYDGGAVKRKLFEMFGEDIEFYPVREIKTEANGWDFVPIFNLIHAGREVCAYDSDYDEFYYYPFGTEGRVAVGGLYAAEKDKDRIYLYEVRAFVQCSPAPYVDEATGEYVNGSHCGISDIDDYKTITEWSDPEPGVDAETMIQEKEKYPKFKWTFTKNAEGNYVFESLERVE